MDENEYYYVAQCPNCKGKMGMFMTEELLSTYESINAKQGCPYCSFPFLISNQNLHIGLEEEVVTQNSSGL